MHLNRKNVPNIPTLPNKAKTPTATVPPIRRPPAAGHPHQCCEFVLLYPSSYLAMQTLKPLMVALFSARILPATSSCLQKCRAIPCLVILCFSDWNIGIANSARLVKIPFRPYWCKFWVMVNKHCEFLPPSSILSSSLLPLPLWLEEHHSLAVLANTHMPIEKYN